ncbi:hypothetical protein ES703_25699 [subsurface metagenome]
MNREAEIQDDLKDAIEKVARKSRFDGVEIRTPVERGYPVGNREVDLTLFMKGEEPFMFIETKKKGKREPSLLFHPIDRYSVGQVASYAAIFKRDKGKIVPFVAIANPSTIVAFKTPE